MAMVKVGPDEQPDPDKLREFFNPGQVAQCVTQAIQMCWMMLPSNKKTMDILEREFRGIVDRSLSNMREDEKRFGADKP